MAALLVRALVAQDDYQHLNGVCCMNGSEDDAIPSRYLAVAAFVFFPL